MSDQDDLGDTDGWTAKPVDGNPFDDRPRFTGHVAATPNPDGFSQIDQMVQAHNRANPASAPDQPPEKQYYGGAYGAALDQGFQNVAGASGSRNGTVSDLAGQGVGKAAGEIGVPDADGLGRARRPRCSICPCDGPTARATAAHGAVSAGLGDLHNYAPAIIAGPMALTADRMALTKAKALSAMGWSKEDILRKTNWSKDEIGKWGLRSPIPEFNTTKIRMPRSWETFSMLLTLPLPIRG